MFFEKWWEIFLAVHVGCGILDSIFLCPRRSGECGFGRGEFSPFLVMCPRRNAGNHGVTKTENGSDLTLYAPPFFTPLKFFISITLHDSRFRLSFFDLCPCFSLIFRVVKETFVTYSSPTFRPSFSPHFPFKIPPFFPAFKVFSAPGG